MSRRFRWLRFVFWLVVLGLAWNAVGWAIGRPVWFSVLSIPAGFVLGLTALALAVQRRSDATQE